MRLFNSLNSTAYNSKTLQLLQDNEHAKITIATDKLSVGVDVPIFETVTVIDPVDLDDLWQKSGRVGRDKQRVKLPRIIVYIPNHKMTALKDLVAGSQGHADVTNSRQQKKSRPTCRRQPKTLKYCAVKSEVGWGMSSHCIVGCARGVCLLPGGKKCGFCAPKRVA